MLQWLLNLLLRVYVRAVSRQIVFGTAEELLTVDFGAPLHSLVVLGHLHELETEFLQLYRPSTSTSSAGAGAGACSGSASEAADE